MCVCVAVCVNCVCVSVCVNCVSTVPCALMCACYRYLFFCTDPKERKMVRSEIAFNRVATELPPVPSIAPAEQQESRCPNFRLGRYYLAHTIVNEQKKERKRKENKIQAEIERDKQSEREREKIDRERRELSPFSVQHQQKKKPKNKHTIK